MRGGSLRRRYGEAGAGRRVGHEIGGERNQGRGWEKRWRGDGGPLVNGDSGATPCVLQACCLVYTLPENPWVSGRFHTRRGMREAMHDGSMHLSSKAPLDIGRRWAPKDGGAR